MGDQPDSEFWDVADAFIRLANERSATVDIAKLSAALMYAAARYNTFALVRQAPSPQAAESEGLQYLVDQYTKMCRENMAQQIAHRWSSPESGA